MPNAQADNGLFKMLRLAHSWFRGDTIWHRTRSSLSLKVSSARLLPVRRCLIDPISGQASASVNLASTYIALGWSDTAPTMVSSRFTREELVLLSRFNSLEQYGSGHVLSRYSDSSRSVSRSSKYIPHQSHCIPRQILTRICVSITGRPTRFLCLSNEHHQSKYLRGIRTIRHHRRCKRHQFHAECLSHVCHGIVHIHSQHEHIHPSTAFLSSAISNTCQSGQLHFR